MHMALHAPFIGGWTTNQKLELLTFPRTRARAARRAQLRGIHRKHLADFFADLSDAERMLVLQDGVKWPNSALSVLAKLPPSVDLGDARADPRARSGGWWGLEQSDAVRKLAIGIVAVLGRSGDAESMAYLREVYERDPARRGYIAMALAQSPDGENWPLLVQSLHDRRWRLCRGGLAEAGDR